jgi:pyrimidine deaminase RibD-like protein
MNIHELSSYNLADAIKFHTELNPRLWNDREHLHPQIRAKLLDIARDFQEFLGVSNLELEDITVSGSNAAYTYTPHSDIDLHLVVKMPEDNNDIYQELFNAKKYQYNDMHNIKVGGADVELYVQPADQPPVSLGEYSVLHNQWLQVPKKEKANINQTLVRNKYQTLAAQIEEALKQADSTKITALTDKIKKMRQTGLAKNGEFGPENLAFKMLRTQGLIDRLHKAKNAARDAELSIEETQKLFRYGFASSQLDEVGMTPDGVSPSTRMFFDDESGKSELESTLHKFADQIVDELGIKNIPEIIFHHGTDWTKSTGSFGQYSPDNNTLQLAVSGRHILDIVRTMAHELTHCKQGEIGDFPTWAGETGSPWEDQANAMAGRILRGFASEKPELFADVKLEEASGYIPTRAQAKDKRFSTALTVDIKPGQTGQEANKLNLQTDAQGKPALLMKSKNLRESKEKINLDSKLLHLLELIKKHQHEDPHKFGKVAAVLIDGAEKESSGVSSRTKEGKMHHAERNAIASHLKRFGSIGPDAVMVTTLSPCCHNLKDRAGASCTDLLKKYGIKRVWAGYQDPAQHPHDEYPFMMEVTNNPDIFRACKDRYQEFAGGHLAAQLAEDELVESLRQEFALLEDEFLGEIKMTGKNLSKLASDIKDVKVGLEFEMIVPNNDVDVVEPEWEPDMDQDQRARSFSDIRDFFHDGDYNGRRAVDDLIEELTGEYEEWKQEQTAEQWERDGVDYIRDFVEVNDLFDREEAIDTARDEVIDANPGLPPESKDFQDLLRARLNELQEQFVLEAYEDRGRIYDDAFEAFAEEQNEEYDQGSFLDDRYQTMSDIQSNFDISWPYYYDINDGQTETETDVKRIALEFMNESGLPYNNIAIANSYHGRYELWDGKEWIDYGDEKPDFCFTIEPDGSLKGDDDGDVGLEFVSPPIPLDQVSNTMSKVQQWAARNGVYTGKANKTSMHTNISIPGYDLDKLDYVKAALLLGDEYVLREFDRIGNYYAAPAIEKVRELVKQKPDKAKQLLDKMKSQLNAAASKLIHSGVTDKMTSINTKDNRIEFRSPGGDYLNDIAKNPKKMQDIINRMVVAMDAAMDPDKYKEEYETKLYKALTGDLGSRLAKTGQQEWDVKSKKNVWYKDERVVKDKETGKEKTVFTTKQRPGFETTVMAKTAKEAWKEAKVKLPAGAEESDYSITPKMIPTPANDGNKDLMKYFARYAAGELPQSALKSFVRQAQLERNVAKGKATGKMWWKVSNPANSFASIEVVADNAEEAIASAILPGNYPDWARVRNTLKATPIRPYQPFEEKPKGPTLGDRPSNPNGNYVIVNQQNQSVPVYRYMASGDQDALLVLRQWIAANPGQTWTFKKDVEQALGQPGAATVPQGSSTGNWGVWIPSLDRFATIANAGPRRFESETDAQAWIQDYNTRHSGNDIGLVAREVAQPVNRNTLMPTGPGPWEVFRRSDGSSVAELGDTNRMGAEVEARRVIDQRGEAPELYGVRTLQSNAAQAGQFQEPNDARGDLNPRGPGPWEIYRLSDNSSVRNLTHTDRQMAGQEARMALGMRGEAPELYGVRTRQSDAAQGGTVDVAGEQPAAPQTLTRPGQGQQQFTGTWRVLDPEDREIYRFSGVGNNQSDANRVAMNWLRSNPRHMQAGVTVAPEMA